jgi:hypothetical protein
VPLGLHARGLDPKVFARVLPDGADRHDDGEPIARGDHLRRGPLSVGGLGVLDEEGARCHCFFSQHASMMAAA